MAQKIPLVFYNGLVSEVDANDSIKLPSIEIFTFNKFNQVLSVAGGATANVYSHVVSETNYTLSQISVSGQNKATFTVYINGVKQGLVRTWYTNFNAILDFPALPLEIADVLLVTASNDSNSISNFEARITGYTY